MTTSLPNRHGGVRPRAKTLVRLDLYNAYARLGVSPLMSTEEIKACVQRKRKELMRRRRTRGQQQFGEEEAEITAVQAIEDEIGSPKARAKYDQANPQNELLTVQPSPHDHWFDPKHRSALVTRWLVEELGRDALLPSPESIRLWAPNGIDAEVTAFLQGFLLAGSDSASSPSAGAGTDNSYLPLPDVADLDSFVTDSGATDSQTETPAPPAFEKENKHG